ncbi:MAG TPA: VanW family protein, partial [Candidatus Bathyarchaeia archaeon]|nr:VanW family protein [Candidatus Bathyarchaeia archaeon]
SYHFAYWQKIYPGIVINDLAVGNKTIAEATAKIDHQVAGLELKPLILSHQDQEWPVNLKKLNFAYDVNLTAKKAYSIGRSGHLTRDLNTKIHLWFQGANLDLEYQFDQSFLEEKIASIAAELFVPAIEPAIQVFETIPTGASSRVVIEAGKEGQELNVRKTIGAIKNQLARASFSSLQLPIITLSPTLTDEQLKKTKHRAEKLLSKKITLSWQENRWELNEQEMIGFLSFTDQLEDEEIASYTATLAKNINRPPQNAAFQFEGSRVTQFAPAKEGQALNQDQTNQLISEALEKMEVGEENQLTVDLPVKTAPPEITVEEINNLGIKKLLGRGVSSFRGSIASRINNIQLASSRLNGLLIPPGETFSFNQALGEVSRETGFQEAYIIKEGRTILGDGGGVCQVSTTFFRAALDAGLPIIERQAHAYRVAYYEQGFSPGLDATVWEPHPDLKVKNDTPAHILIQAGVNTGARSLAFELYGTADGRVATIGKSRIWDQIPPPPDLYQDDPTLPIGTTKQIDWKAWGAKVAFDWKVVRNNEVLQERTFYSNYRPWQAIFLRGTGPAQ